eukprot:COSAG02_NODE_1559_length_11928_cov_2.712233_1_plen_56_part_00
MQFARGMDPEAVATLSAITGLPAAEAEGFLEMGEPASLLQWTDQGQVHELRGDFL